MRNAVADDADGGACMRMRSRGGNGDAPVLVDQGAPESGVELWEDAGGANNVRVSFSCAPTDYPDLGFCPLSRGHILSDQMCVSHIRLAHVAVHGARSNARQRQSSTSLRPQPHTVHVHAHSAPDPPHTCMLHARPEPERPTRPPHESARTVSASVRFRSRPALHAPHASVQVWVWSAIESAGVIGNRPRDAITHLIQIATHMLHGKRYM
ncbi:hypothetical protein DFH09DRAFT_1327805 [Mycena vulgaris]|nr:hypothetical protein DFH09DRAFT_1327805 [Mycena vulgaris]